MASMKDLLGDAPAATYPFSPGFKEGTTSKEAADSMRPRVDLLRDKVLEAIEQMPSTTDEVAAMLGESVLSVRPRCSELRKIKKIRPRFVNGKAVRRANDSLRWATVWEAGAEP